MARRRGQGEGSMRERSPGVWQLRVSAGVDPITGESRVVTLTFRGSKTAAAKQLAELGVKQRRAGPRLAGSVDDIVGRWLEVAPIGRTTRDVYDDALAHLPAAWRARRADSIRFADVGALYRHLVDVAGVGAWTVRKLHTVLSGAFTNAVREGELVANPCTRAKLPAVGRNTRIPTPAEMTALFAKATAQESILLTTAIAAGGRRGEMVSLRWSHLDLEAGKIRIVESTTVLNEVKSTKTGSDDLLPLAPDVVEALKDWRLAQIERALDAGVPYHRDGYVLSDVDDASRPWRPNLATQRFIALRKAAGVSGVRLQDMRHVTATYLLTAGIDLPTVAKHMRHSRPSTTADVYAHVLAGQDQAIAGVLGAVVKKATATGE